MKPYLFPVFFALTIIFISCGNNLDDEAVRALKKLYAWKTGDNLFALTNNFILNSDLSNGKSPDLLKLSKIWFTATRKGSVDKVEILKNLNDGHTANILYNLYFLDGSTEMSNMALLIKIGGIWKLSIN